jgi:WD40 repeat protein
MSAESDHYQYWAFISYSHQDNLATRGDGTGDHIPWANWLHEELETFRIPDGYRDRLTRSGEPMPERFFPTFRDEPELPTSHDLGGQIRDALDRSRFLIVIASPRSARSPYVDAEVRHFRQLGRGDRILTLIVDGEPNVRLHPKPGWAAGDDCFCPALVHPLQRDGTVDEAAPLPEEPIAADVRVKDVEPPRELRATERDQPEGRALLDFMKLKLIAGLMGVGLAKLVQRDKRRAEEELSRVRREASRTEFLFARQLLDLKDYPKAYARLAKAIETNPENRAACVLGLEEIRCGANAGAMRQYRHEGEVLSAVFSPDGARVLTASCDGTARVWSSVTGEPLCDPLQHEVEVNSAVFSPDGTLILTASNDHTARRWDAMSGESLAEPLRHADRVLSAIFSPDGTRILTTSEDHSEGIWDTATGRPLIEPVSRGSKIRSAVFSPDGLRILTAAGSDVRLWQVVGGDVVTKPFRHQGRVSTAVFSADAARVLTASEDHTAQLWDVPAGELREIEGRFRTAKELFASSPPSGEPFRHRAAVCSAVFSPDGTRILTASADRTAQIWDVASRRLLGDAMQHPEGVRSASFSPDGTCVLTICDDYVARLWNASDGRLIAPSMRHQSRIHCASFSPDGARILTASWDHTARIWNAASGRPLAGKERGMRAPVFSLDGTRLLAMLPDRVVGLWETDGGLALGAPIKHEREVRSAVFSPDNTRILTASGDIARLWDVIIGQPLAISMQHEPDISFAVFSPDSSRILTTSFDGNIQLWDATSGERLSTSVRHESAVVAAAFGPHGSCFVSASWDHTARLWDTASGQMLLPPLKHQGAVNSAVFSPDGTRILTASSDQTAQLWSAASGRPLLDPFRHDDRVQSAVFSHDGARILTASSDHTARLWDAMTGQQIAEPIWHDDAVRSAVFSPDDLRILTSSSDFIVWSWDATTGELSETDSGRLSRLLRVVGGRRVDGGGLMESVPLEEMRRLREDFDTATEMDPLLRWWWNDPFTRNIHPSSETTVPDFVRRRIREVLDWPDEKVKASALREARDAFPHHPLVLLGLAELGQHGDPAWLANYAVSRLLAEPHYHVPLPPPRNVAERAARAHELSAGLAEDCHLAARLLHRQQRTELAKKALARAVALAPDNAEYRTTAAGLGFT